MGHRFKVKHKNIKTFTDKMEEVLWDLGLVKELWLDTKSMIQKREIDKLDFIQN